MWRGSWCWSECRGCRTGRRRRRGHEGDRRGNPCSGRAVGSPGRFGLRCITGDQFSEGAVCDAKFVMVPGMDRRQVIPSLNLLSDRVKAGNESDATEPTSRGRSFHFREEEPFVRGLSWRISSSVDGERSVCGSSRLVHSYLIPLQAIMGNIWPIMALSVPCACKGQNRPKWEYDLDGRIGIVGQQCMWLTHLRFDGARRSRRIETP